MSFSLYLLFPLQNPPGLSLSPLGVFCFLFSDVVYRSSGKQTMVWRSSLFHVVSM